MSRQFLESQLPKRAYRVSEIADMLSASEKTVYAWIRNGTLPARKIKNHFVVLADEFEKLLKHLPSVSASGAAHSTGS